MIHLQHDCWVTYCKRCSYDRLTGNNYRGQFCLWANLDLVTSDDLIFSVYCFSDKPLTGLIVLNSVAAYLNRLQNENTK